MNDYEERKARRIERYRERARAADAEAAARWNSLANRTLLGMGGEPIKIGHHSEGRHRRLIERAHRDCDRASAAMAKAEHYRAKAAGAERNRAVSSDDPEALDKLHEKLAALEARQERLKADNKALRKAKVAPDDPEAAEKMKAAGVSPAGIVSLLSLVRIVRFQVTPHFRHPSYELTNNNANIKRVQRRIAELEARQSQPPAEPVEGDGFTIEEDTDWGRILIHLHDGKPAEPVRRWLKSNGWRWAPSRTAWVRHLNDAGRWAAKVAAEELPRLLKGESL